MVGAACAYYASRRGLSVTVIDRGPVAGGTTGAGEGNLLVSDKEPGPELELALLSARLWRELAEPLPLEFEFEAKGGLVVAFDAAGLDALREFATGQEKAGVVAEEVPADRLGDLEPHLTPAVAGGFHYPQDAQVQPALAAAHLLRASGAHVRLGEEVAGILTAPSGEVTGVRTSSGAVHAPHVVNAPGAVRSCSRLVPMSGNCRFPAGRCRGWWLPEVRRRCSSRGWCCPVSGSSSRGVGRCCSPSPPHSPPPEPASPPSSRHPATSGTRATECHCTAAARSPKSTAPTGCRP
ncbi:hypothetical protein GCM10009753_45030 [Streptantibioticus ferralitis]